MATTMSDTGAQRQVMARAITSVKSSAGALLRCRLEHRAENVRRCRFGSFLSIRHVAEAAWISAR